MRVSIIQHLFLFFLFTIGKLTKILLLFINGEFILDSERDTFVSEVFSLFFNQIIMFDDYVLFFFRRQKYNFQRGIGSNTIFVVVLQ